MKILLASVSLALAVPVAAGTVPPEAIEYFTNHARENVTRARLLDGSNVPAETPDELAKPIVPAALDKQTVERGFLTAAMQICGMDWQNDSFVPYMKAIRASKRYSNKQHAYIGFLHGLVVGTMVQAGASNDCSDEARARWLEVARTTKIDTP